MSAQSNDMVDDLICWHIASEICSYQGNLSLVIHALKNDWIPPHDHPVIPNHIQLLRKHMEEIGCSEDDSFLLRFGLTVPGIQRGIVPPMMVLEQNRGGFSARRQREAEGQILRLRDALNIGRQLIPNLSSDTKQAIMELVDVVSTRAPSKHFDWVKGYQHLSEAQIRSLGLRAMELLQSRTNTVREVGAGIIQRLACFRPSTQIEQIREELIKQHIFWPPSIYCDSGNGIASELLSRFQMNLEPLLLNHLLLALAWTRSEVAEKAFCKWITSPPVWASQLHVPLIDYLPSAGWSLGEHGQRLELISLDCRRLLPESASGPHFPCRITSETKCPSCDGKLSWLFDFSTIRGKITQRFLADSPERILCCLHCSCFKPTYAGYDADGSEEWLAPFEKCQFQNYGERKAVVRHCNNLPFPPFACAEPFGIEDASTIGGVPMWLQHADFPRCIKCSQLMPFLAQLDNSTLGEEGIYYAFFCGHCRVSAVTYQQT